jgi:hypothetical protein
VILPGQEGIFADADTTESGAGRIFEANGACRATVTLGVGERRVE